MFVNFFFERLAFDGLPDDVDHLRVPVGAFVVSMVMMVVPVVVMMGLFGLDFPSRGRLHDGGLVLLQLVGELRRRLDHFDFLLNSAPPPYTRSRCFDFQLGVLAAAVVVAGMAV